MKKLLITLIALLLCVAPAFAEEDEPQLLIDGDYRYYLTDEGAVITWYEYASPLPEVIEIPAVLGGYPVIAIEYGFSTCYNEFLDDDIQRIVVPEGVKTIGGAFICCSSVAELVLPASLEEIPEFSLSHVRAEITLHPDNPHFTCEDGFLIDLRSGTLLYVAPAAAEMPLPPVRRLGMRCLENWNDWEKDVVLPATVEEIGPCAFYDTELASVTLNEGLKRIENGAFSCFIRETPVEIPASVEMVEWGAFAEAFEEASAIVCRNPATKVETYFEYAARTGDDWWMEHYTAELFTYELTDEGAVITNWNHSDYGDAVPTVVTLPSKLGGQPVVGIAENALNTYTMYDEHSFTLVIPEGVKWLSDGAFWCCHNADAVYFPANLTEIPEGCFDHVYATFVVAEGNPRYEMQDGFLIDKQASTIVYTTPECQGKPIPAVRRIGAASMDNWFTAWGQDVVIPEGVVEIGSFAFYDWEFGTVTLPQSLRVIETEAFNVFITQPVHLPAQVELVQRGAFFGGEDSVVVVAASESTHFETAEEYVTRVGYPWWEDEE